ncbi:MAG: DUF1700 domain-containing protein [Lachnoclostridium sp.]|jgi:hypothetical protein
MTKSEFIEELRATLTGEIPDDEVISNIRFYNEYITNKSIKSSEEEVLSQLGDPRLIARTIIDTYQISHGPMYGNSRHEGAYQDTQTRDGNTYEDYQSNYDDDDNDYGERIKINIRSGPKWYVKLVLALLAVVGIILFFIIGGIFLRLFFTVGLPLLLIYFGYKLIMNNFKR